MSTIQNLRFRRYLVKNIEIKTLVLVILFTVQACRKPSLEGGFYFVNKSSQMVSLTCYGSEQAYFNQNIPSGKLVRFSSFMINSYFSFPDQVDSIIIESQGKIFIESCPFRKPEEGGDFLDRTCEASERSLFNNEAYEWVSKKKYQAGDYYYYFTETDLARLK
ncbi:hypothetical protein [Jiulongibacter sp. NS-SX5]|uniref:hypothetical protein n=1 Tax=Jiulongibacter sp. NS-SX5 TaxID=3463854 RepID=UPI004057D7A4